MWDQPDEPLPWSKRLESRNVLKNSPDTEGKLRDWIPLKLVMMLRGVQIEGSRRRKDPLSTIKKLA